MNRTSASFSFLRLLLCAILSTCLGATILEAQGRKKNLTSKLFVAEVTGTAQIYTGEIIADLTNKSVYAAQGTVIETKDDSSNTMVLSNATGVYFDPSTRLEVRKFVQEPFTPNRNDLELEPSISTTETFLSRGLIGLCTSQLVAGTTMIYITPHGSVRIKGRKAVIEVTPEGTKVSLLEGEITVRAGPQDAGGQTLQPGQQALISPNGTIRIQAIPANEAGALADKVSMACLARKSVYFDVRQKQDGDLGDDLTAFDEGPGPDEIIAVDVTPPGISPDVTVSAASIPRPN